MGLPVLVPAVPPIPMSTWPGGFPALEYSFPISKME